MELVCHCCIDFKVTSCGDDVQRLTCLFKGKM